mgnify:CR=1 FL=1
MAQILIMTKYSQYSDNLSVLIISSPVLKTLRTNNQHISSHILKCRIENNFSSLYFIKLKNERYFCPPKAKAPVIFKVKIASTLAFHIQFWVQKSRIPFSDFLLPLNYALVLLITTNRESYHKIFAHYFLFSA